MPFFPFLQLFVADAKKSISELIPALCCLGAARAENRERKERILQDWKQGKENPAPLAQVISLCEVLLLPSLSIRWSLLPSPAAAGNWKTQLFSEITRYKAAVMRCLNSDGTGQEFEEQGKFKLEN